MDNAGWRSRLLDALIAASICALAIWTRWPSMGKQIDGDEFQVLTRFVDEPIAKTFRDFDGGTNHPLYNLLARIPCSIESNLSNLRLPAFVASILSPAIMYLMLRSVVGLLPSLLSSLAFTLSTSHILHSSFARGYTLAAFFVTMGTVALIRALRSNRKYDWMLFTFCTVAAAYSHIWTVLALVGQFVYLALRALIVDKSVRRYGPVGWTIAAGVLVIAVYSPMIGDILKRAQDRNPSFTPIFFDALWRMGEVGGFKVLRDALSVPLHVMLLAGLIVLAAHRGRYASDATKLQVVTVLISAGLVWLASPMSFFPRYMMFLIPAYWLLFACVIADLQSIPNEHRTWRKALAGFAGLVLTPLAVIALIWPEMVDRFPLLADAPGATIAVLFLSAIPMEGVSSEKG